MKVLNIIAAVAAALAFPAVSGAQEDIPVHRFSMGADIMQRGELRFGGTAAGSVVEGDMAAFLLGRTRLGLSYKWKDRIETAVTAQFSGTWGSRDMGALSMYEAWVRFNPGKGFFVKAGRQDLSYDDQRIFGSDNWSMTGLSHDALKLGYEGYGHKVHLFGAFNQNASNIDGGTYYIGGLQPYKTMAALWYHYDIPRFPLGVSIMAMDVGMQGGVKDVDEVIRHQQILGTFVSFRPSKWNVEAAYYHQMGKDENGIHINAWMASGKVVFSPLQALSLRLGYDYLSGDSDFATPAVGQIGLTQHKEIRGFNSIYGSHHQFYGAMDFFYVSTYVGGFTPGLQNSYLGATWKPVAGLALDASYHFLATAAKLQNADRPLGHEFEFSAGYSFTPSLSLSTGYTFMRGTETMVVLKRTSDKRELHWAWLMLRYTPSFFQLNRQGN